MGKRKFWKTPDRLVSEIRYLRSSGLTIRVISAMLGVSERTVRKYSISRRKRVLGYSSLEERDDEIIRLRDQEHLKWDDIAERMMLTTHHTHTRYNRRKAYHETNC